MIIPFSKQPQQGLVPQGPKPSETDLLLALGAMHSAGRFQTASNEKMPLFNADEILKRGYGTAAEMYYALTKSGKMSKEEARQFIEKGPNNPELSGEQIQEFIKKNPEPWKREIEN